MKMSKLDKFKRYLSIEIGIEYKACLYFYCIMVFYCIYLALQHTFSASVLYMCEMIFTAYIMGYLQVMLLKNFDEAENITGREFLSMLLCTAIYTGCSYLFCWFDRSLLATGVFFLFILFSYWCVYLINKIKRNIDTNQLNEMLTAFKQEDIEKE